MDKFSVFRGKSISTGHLSMRTMKNLGLTKVQNEALTNIKKTKVTTHTVKSLIKETTFKKLWPGFF